MKKLLTAMAASIALSAGTPIGAQAEDLSFMIVRSNLQAFDDVQIQNAFDRIAERTDGEMTVSTVFNGSLPIASTEWFRAVSTGDLDMSMIVGDYHAGDFPLLGLIQTPFLFKDQVEKNLAIAASFPIMQREANKLNVQLLASIPFSEIGFWTTEDFQDISNLDGVKLRAQSKLFSDMAVAIGGEPVPVEWAEAYTSLQRGLVKGIFTGYESFTSAKLQEVAPYAHRIYLSNQVPYIGVNKTKWDALSAETRAIAMEEIGRAMQIIQANIPKVISGEIAKQTEGGLKGYRPEPAGGWFEVMTEAVAKPTLESELERSGEAGEELIAVIEDALGRSLR